MPRRADLVSALVWLVFGATVAVASWRMDRLADRGIEVWSAPGLTPGIIGVLIVVIALALGWQAWRPAPDEAALDAEAQDDIAVAGSARRTLVAGALCVVFAGVTLGLGVPFVVEGAVFVFVFTALFSWQTWRAENRVGLGVVQTLVVAVVACTLISLLFERVFLVRLP